jgi:hypothetical protein
VAKKGNRGINRPQANQQNEEPIGPRHDVTMLRGGSEGTEAGAPDALVDFAEDMGKFLGTVQSKATSWLEQRKAIAEQLAQIRDTANQYLQQLGTEGAHLVERFDKARRGRPAGTKNVKRAAGSPAPAEAVEGSGKAKRTMSAEARARIAEAQRKRWAKHRRAAAKTGAR